MLVLIYTIEWYTHVGFFLLLHDLLAEYPILLGIRLSLANIVGEAFVQFFTQVPLVLADLVQTFQFLLAEVLDVRQHRLVFLIFAFQFEQLLL